MNAHSHLRAVWAGLLLCSATAHCGGAGATPGSPAQASAGQFRATWSAVGTVVSPPGVPPQTYTDTAIITITPLSDHELLAEWQVGVNTPSGAITFAMSGNSGSVEGAGTGGICWTGRLTNGNEQSTCATTASLEIVGDVLTQHQTGTFTGMTPQNVPYPGTYEGTWTGNRIQ